METFIKPIQIRWSDIDPNFHVLHSKYYDFGAYSRIAFFVEQGFTTAMMKEQHIGPILFREECIYKREINFGDEVTIDLRITKCTTDYSRWSMEHRLWKNSDTLAAVMSVDGAWMDTEKRKLALPPSIVTSIFDAAPKAENFQLIKNNLNE